MNCIMYSILVNPTHAVTGALAPSSPFCGFIFSFSRDLIFFSFSLFLTPLWLCIGDQPVHLMDFAPPRPRFYRSPWAHTLISSVHLVLVPFFLLSSLHLKSRLSPVNPVSSVLCTPDVPPAGLRFSTCGIAPASEAGGPGSAWRRCLWGGRRRSHYSLSSPSPIAGFL